MLHLKAVYQHLKMQAPGRYSETHPINFKPSLFRYFYSFQSKKTFEEAFYFLHCYPARIRTLTFGIKNRCPTFRLPGKIVLLILRHKKSLILIQEEASSTKAINPIILKNHILLYPAAYSFFSVVKTYLSTD